LGAPGSVRERYLQTGLISFIETRLEKGKVMEELLYKPRQVGDVVGGRTLSYQKNAALIVSLVAAVRLLHLNFVYHQDLNAKNIMVINYSSDLMPHAVLLDMGAACLVDECEKYPRSPSQTKTHLLRVDRRRQYRDVMMLLDIIYDWLNGVYNSSYPPIRVFPVQNQRVDHSRLWDIVKRNWEPAHHYDAYSHEFESIPGTFPHVTADDLYKEFRALIFPK
jgi:serine/threonine protein kinase